MWPFLTLQRSAQQLTSHCLVQFTVAFVGGTKNGKWYKWYLINKSTCLYLLRDFNLFIFQKRFYRMFYLFKMWFLVWLSFYWRVHRPGGDLSTLNSSMFLWWSHSKVKGTLSQRSRNTGRTWKKILWTQNFPHCTRLHQDNIPNNTVQQHNEENNKQYNNTMKNTITSIIYMTHWLSLKVPDLCSSSQSPQDWTGNATGYLHHVLLRTPSPVL